MILLKGKGRFEFRIHTGRIEYETVAPHIGEVPEAGLQKDCLAMIVLDDGQTSGNSDGIAAGVFLNQRESVAAGWFHWKQAQQYRLEMPGLGITGSSTVLCLGKLCGGSEVQYRKGPKRMCFNLYLDLEWPLRIEEEWYALCEPYLGSQSVLR